MGGGWGDEERLFRLILAIYQVYFRVTLKTEHFLGSINFLGIFLVIVKITLEPSIWTDSLVRPKYQQLIVVWKQEEYIFGYANIGRFFFCFFVLFVCFVLFTLDAGPAYVAGKIQSTPPPPNTHTHTRFTHPVGFFYLLICSNEFKILISFTLILSYMLNGVFTINICIITY